MRLKSVLNKKNLRLWMILVIGVAFISLAFIFSIMGSLKTTHKLPSDSRLNLYQDQLLTFGTWVDIQLLARSQAEADQVLSRLAQEFNTMNARWHAWLPSALTQLNADLQSGRWFEINADMLSLIERNRQAYEESRGLFNPALGKLFEFWGFYKNTPKREALPSTQELAWLMEAPPQFQHIEIQNQKIRGTHPHLQLDFGGIAKGFGLNVIAQVLKNANIYNALVNAGGDVRAFGQRGNRPWKVAVQSPFGRDVLGFIEIKGDESIFTSGTYERNYVVGSHQVHHIFDPRTGFPTQGIASATVVTDDSVDADVAATALIIAGKERWQEIAENLRVKAALLVTDSGQLLMSESMKNRLQLVAKPSNNQ
ncbi:MAG: FAD:protein FMN transferase [Pseudomonadota bacterium]